MSKHDAGQPSEAGFWPSSTPQSSKLCTSPKCHQNLLTRCCVKMARSTQSNGSSQASSSSRLVRKDERVHRGISYGGTTGRLPAEAWGRQMRLAGCSLSAICRRHAFCCFQSCMRSAHLDSAIVQVPAGPATGLLLAAWATYLPVGRLVAGEPCECRRASVKEADQLLRCLL